MRAEIEIFGGVIGVCNVMMSIFMTPSSIVTLLTRSEPLLLNFHDARLRLLGLTLKLGDSALCILSLSLELSSTFFSLEHLLLGGHGPIVCLFSYMSSLILHFLCLLGQVLHFLLQARVVSKVVLLI